ncbi:MAG TPA: SIR2 family protein, partial [Solirubrobacterales bacterium]
MDSANSYIERPLEELVEKTVESTSTQPMVFLLGAGASAAAPSFLPQPKLIQSEVYRCVAPQGASEDHRKLIVESLPEIYHEVLLELGGGSTREIWKLLSLWERPEEAPSLAAYDLGPNIVHHLVVYLSWKTGRPVVTVNFDNMLERAAGNLGLRPDARLDAEPAVDTVAIWKLHGTVEHPESIRTTLQGITATDRTVLDRIEREFDRSRGCLIGYSGRDIDFFPFLCGWEAARPVYWLTLG